MYTAAVVSNSSTSPVSCWRESAVVLLCLCKVGWDLMCLPPGKEFFKKVCQHGSFVTVQNLLSVWVTSTAEAGLGEMFWPPERSSAALPWREASGVRPHRYLL